MTQSMWCYYVLNQILVGGDLTGLPEEATKVFGEEKIEEITSKLKSLPRYSFSPLEQVFLNCLRTPDYGLCLTANDGKLLLIDRVASLCREKDWDVETCDHWASAIILEVVVMDSGLPFVADGVLHVSSSLMQQGCDLDRAMRRMFAYYVWGTEHPTTASKNLVQLLLSLTDPKEDISVTKKDVLNIVEACVSNNIHPTDLSRTVLRVCDMREALAMTGTLVWWPSHQQDVVSLVLPRGTKSTLVHVKLQTEAFLDLCMNAAEAVKDMYIKGDKLMVGNKAI